MEIPFSGYSYDFGTISYPNNFFIAEPTAVVSGRIGGLFNVVSYSNVYQVGVSVSLQSNANGSQTCYAYIYAIGKWK